jgi:hypothetical protein
MKVPVQRKTPKPPKMFLHRSMKEKLLKKKSLFLPIFVSRRAAWLSVKP